MRRFHALVLFLIIQLLSAGTAIASYNQFYITFHNKTENILSVFFEQPPNSSMQEGHAGQSVIPNGGSLTISYRLYSAHHKRLFSNRFLIVNDGTPVAEMTHIVENYEDMLDKTKLLENAISSGGSPPYNLKITRPNWDTYVVVITTDDTN